MRQTVQLDAIERLTLKSKLWFLLINFLTARFSSEVKEIEVGTEIEVEKIMYHQRMINGEIIKTGKLTRKINPSQSIYLETSFGEEKIVERPVKVGYWKKQDHFVLITKNKSVLVLRIIK